jgi:hypothetical protein
MDEDVISDVDKLVDTPVNYFAKYLKNVVSQPKAKIRVIINSSYNQ